MQTINHSRYSIKLIRKLLWFHTIQCPQLQDANTTLVPEKDYLIHFLVEYSQSKSCSVRFLPFRIRLFGIKFRINWYNTWWILKKTFFSFGEAKFVIMGIQSQKSSRWRRPDQIFFLWYSTILLILDSFSNNLQTFPCECKNLTFLPYNQWLIQVIA